MDWRKLLPLALILGASLQAQAQSQSQSGGSASTYGLGRTPTPEEVRAWDISISPTGQELPPGHGTAKDGEPLWSDPSLLATTSRGPGSDAEAESVEIVVNRSPRKFVVEGGKLTGLLFDCMEYDQDGARITENLDFAATP